MNSLLSFTPTILAWLLCYAIHSSVLLGVAMLCQKLGLLKQRNLAEIVWRFALFGGLLTATLQLSLQLFLQDNWQTPVHNTASAVIAPTMQPVDNKIEKISVSPAPSVELTTITEPLGRDTASATSTLPPAVSTSNAIVLSQNINQLASALLFTWMLYCLLICIKLALSVRQLNRLAASMPLIDRADLNTLVRKLLPTTHSNISIRRNTMWNSPFVCPNGSVCLPDWVLENSDTTQCHAMLAHEIQHIVRHDSKWRIAQQFIIDIFFFQVLNRYAERHLSLLAEIACDQAAQQVSERKAIAQALLSCAENILSQKLPALALPMAQASSLVQRINLLLDEDYMHNSQQDTHKGKLISLSTIAMLGLTAVSFSMPTIALVIPSPEAKTLGISNANSVTIKELPSAPSSLTASSALDDLKAPQIADNPEQVDSLTNEIPKPHAMATAATAVLEVEPNQVEQTSATKNNTKPSQQAQLTQATQAFVNKDYAEALRIYSELANAGNAEAQALKGEMLWHGDGQPADSQEAKIWISKAAAQGHLKAQKFLEMLVEREKRQSELALYTQNFDGGKLKWTEQTCPRPMLPTSKFTKETLKLTLEKMNANLDCYNNYISALQLSLANVSYLPQEIRLIMRSEELEKSKQLAQNIFYQSGLQAKAHSEQMLTDFKNAYQPWYSAQQKTDKFSDIMIAEFSRREYDRRHFPFVEPETGVRSVITSNNPNFTPVFIPK